MTLSWTEFITLLVCKFCEALKKDCMRHRLRPLYFFSRNALVHSAGFNTNIVYVQEYHIRQMDGQTLDAEAKEKVKKCLEAAIERRSSEVRID